MEAEHETINRTVDCLPRLQALPRETGTQNKNSLTKQPQGMDSPGRSGARMILSHDKRYFIKTLVSEEVEQMHHLLKQYLQHIVECHANTMLPHYLGMYRITVNDVETYLCVMRNVFSPRQPTHKKYDLKGSTVDRCASDKEKAKELPTFKDNDFLEDDAKVNIGAEEKAELMNKLTRDVNFLASLHLMDYSLIVGIHDCDRIEPEGSDINAQNSESDGEPVSGEDENGLEEQVPDIGGFAPTPPDSPQPYGPVPAFNGDIDPNIEKFGVKSLEGGPKKEICFLALIDILTRYGMKKRTALAAKTMKHGVGAEISTVHPDQYAKRFLEFIDKCIA
ncbi:phosphatidylinositol 5-phosphate 4-kinase type-2 alpha-like [Dreissena polymorpha]|uniref:phosphatidylinositol 5-phosphate 4-kinase type-2 alpha-like n=1 Tax=Dreissena polymorpha TaxID=45954 RepID=UPI00226409C1|nr:phosphatidylinositol 5-phosphate 4-kinase type-2 alpha-like [Dreissena polymorpha]